MAEATTITELESRIRGFINTARTQHLLLQNAAMWNQLCSSLDAIGDTELCFEAYDKAPTSSGDGETYLLVYGVIQALIIQQDAVQHLSEALSIPFQPNPALTQIREVRNSSVGHPTKRRGKKPRSHFISRISMSKSGFQLMTVYPDHGAAEFTPVDIPAMMAAQREQLCAVMKQVLAELDMRDKEHRAMFANSKLVDAFPVTMSYYFEKIYETIGGTKPREYGGMHVRLLQESLDRFKAGLAERGSAGAYDSVEYHLGLVAHPLDELAKYFASPQSSKLDERDAYIFVHFAQDQMKTLIEMAGEIDSDYEASKDS